MTEYKQYLKRLPIKVIQRMLECDTYYKTLTDIQRDELLCEFSARIEDEMLSNYLG